MSELKHMHAKIECLNFNTEDVRLVITERYGKQEIRMHGEDAKFIIEAIAAAKRRAQPEANADAVKCWKDRMAKPEVREWRGAMEGAMEAEIMELRMILSSNKVDAERYRYIRDTATLDNAVWEALEGYGMTNDAGELLEDEYRAGMDRAIDRAIDAARQAKEKE